jgi:hypothetical protein
VTIVYDRDGNHYGKGAGLSVYANGRQVLASSALGKKDIAIGAPVDHEFTHPLDLAVNYARGGFPVPSASTNNSPRTLYQTVDGRVWFYPEMRNYWSNDGSQSATDWFALDFGGEKEFSSLELYFYADGARFKAPEKYNIQYWKEGNWKNVPQERRSPARPLANGENVITFHPINTSKLRIVFDNPKAAAVALVEVKAFGNSK